MKNQLLLLITTLFTINALSQIKFEKGYFITETNEKINCLIKNVDWKNNPTDFEYKISENSEIKIETINTVKEFRINTYSKYIKSTVNIDRSPSVYKRLSYDENPIFKEETLFLKVLISGNANLYSYEDTGLIRFFYKNENSNIEQLVFKKYRDSESRERKNNSFRKQLWDNLKCDKLTTKRIKNTDYFNSELISVFEDYNSCKNENFISYKKKENNGKIGLNIRPGVNSSSIFVRSLLSENSNVNFDKSLNFRFGLEAEYILPFNKAKWSIILEPTYQQFKSEKFIVVDDPMFDTRDYEYTAKVDYNSIELPIGLRHYMYTNDDSKLFINTSIVFDFVQEGAIDGSGNLRAPFFLPINGNINLAFGVGYNFKNTYSLEFRIYSKRDIISQIDFSESNYKNISLIFGYTVF